MIWDITDSFHNHRIDAMFKKIISCMAGVLMLTGCGDTGLSIYKDTLPKADIKEYFTGHIKAWGIVQDWRGRVVNRFDVNMVGTWSGDTGTLQEEFTYYDGKKQHRTWTITKRPRLGGLNDASLRAGLT